jgi:quinol-cytochrome oxidoreductase complex cytochrome b subunit
VPEWYFLPFYAILRSVPNKLLGVILLLASILLLVLIPFIISYEIRNTNLKPILRFIYYYFLVVCIILGWIGSKDIIEPFYEIGQISTIFYFSYFLFILPLIHKEI